MTSLLMRRVWPSLAIFFLIVNLDSCLGQSRFFCSTSSGKRGQCRPLVKCIRFMHEISSLIKSPCPLATGSRGVCCPHLVFGQRKHPGKDALLETRETCTLMLLFCQFLTVVAVPAAILPGYSVVHLGLQCQYLPSRPLTSPWPRGVPTGDWTGGGRLRGACEGLVSSSEGEPVLQRSSTGGCFVPLPGPGTSEERLRGW